MPRFASFLLLGSLALGASADDVDSDVFGQGKWQPEEGEEPPEWKEAATGLPDYPKDENLLPFEVDGLDSPYRFMVDKTSLSTGKDKVVRYSVVIESSSGARNVYYEGLNCRRKTYKTYAFGTSDGKMRRTRSPEWKYWQTRGVFGYRAQLGSWYLCNTMGFPYSDKDRLVRFERGGQMEMNPEYESYAYPGYQ